MSRIFVIACSLLLLGACTTKHYRESADKEVAKILKQKTPQVPNMDTNFSIEMTNRLSLANLPKCETGEEAFGSDADLEKGARVLSLKEALDIAVKHSNAYQTKKEALFEEALDLTLTRHLYTPIFSGSASVQDQHQKVDVETGLDKVTEDSHSIFAQGNLGVDALLRTGARVSADITSDFLRFVSAAPAGSAETVTHSFLVADLTQPLLRGAGYKIAMETLTQAERNMLYNLRDFARYRKDFTVQIATAYYGVLQNRDTVLNNWRGLQNYKDTVRRERAFFDEGRRSQASLDQLRQAELQTESDWLSALRTYRQSLDSFKITIGLQCAEKVVLEKDELEKLKISSAEFGVDDAVNVALVSRLDLDTERDQVLDAQRHVEVSANALLPQLDFTAGVTVSRSAASPFPVPDWNHYGWTAGLNLNLPFDRVAERNGYRKQLIALDQSKRNLSLAIDNIRMQIADDLRNLDLAKRTYEIRELGVQIADRRVEEQQLRQELGIGTSRDLVDAENDLISSKNQRTAALVSHVVDRLGLFRDMGVLWIGDAGQWVEKMPSKHEAKNH